MSKPIILEDGSLQYDAWYRPGGGMMMRREYLDDDHPQNLYNHLKQNGITPEDYGVYPSGIHEVVQEFQNHSREQLLSEIYSLRKTILCYERAGY